LNLLIIVLLFSSVSVKTLREQTLSLLDDPLAVFFEKMSDFNIAFLIEEDNTKPVFPIDNSHENAVLELKIFAVFTLDISLLSEPDALSNAHELSVSSRLVAKSHLTPDDVTQLARDFCLAQERNFKKSTQPLLFMFDGSVRLRVLSHLLIQFLLFRLK
jgi:hypothetical protein